MTQIRSMAQPAQRRPGELGVHSLDHFNFVVPDVAEAEKFYGLFGLDTKEEGGQALRSTPTAIRTAGAPSPKARARNSITSRSPRSRTTCRAFASGWTSCGSSGSTRRRASSSNGLWFRDPDGTLVEIRVAEKSSPNSKATFEMTGGEPAARTRRTAARRTRCSRAGSRTS